MPSYKPVWLNKELVARVEDFIRKYFGVNPHFANFFTSVARAAILFALSKPEEFKEYLDKQPS